jgi:hypothetical protein
MSGRPTASQIASASFRSFLLDFTYSTRRRAHKYDQAFDRLSLLPKRQRLTRGHHRAMGPADVAEFVKRLRASGGMAAPALEFLILTDTVL